MEFNNREDFINHYEKQIEIQFTKLNFTNRKIIHNILQILGYLYDNSIVNITVSMTGDNEILIYTQKKTNNQDYFKNLVFDNEGSIEYLYIDNTDRRLTNGQVYFEEVLKNSSDFEKIAQLLSTND